MKRLINTLSILTALVTLAIAGTTFAAGDAAYNNIMTLDRFEAALTEQNDYGTYKNMINKEYFMLAMTDQRVEPAQYQNIINIDRFELAMVDQREIDGWYKNVIDRDTFLANLGDPCLT
ncbi:MAG: hypothetical protein OEV28_09740, partial [Nitrospirota bacterium]|nr:hypothetical protein [Nitrospirota bacterium]